MNPSVISPKRGGGITRHIRSFFRRGELAREHGPSRGPALVDAGPEFGIPICGRIPAGIPSYQTEGDEGCLRVDLESVGYPKSNRNRFALRVRGDSMEGKGIFDNDIVIMEFREPYEGAVVAAWVDGETTLKTFYKRNGRPFLKAENPKYRSIVPAQDLSIQGVMIALFRTA